MTALPYLLNVRPSPVDDRDWLAAAIYPRVALPETLDLRNYAQPIRDQGQQGACAAMSGAAMKEYQEALDSGLNEYMSPQFIYNLRADDQEGMTMRDLMSILRSAGTCREVVFPYGSMQKPPQTARDEAARYKIQSYARVTSADELKTALFLNGPCIIAVPVYNFTERMWMQYNGENLLGYHAMSVYGYDNNGFIIRNSWSENWGNKGYCIMPYEHFGLAIEAWTTIDEKSYQPPPLPKKKCFLIRFVLWVFGK